MNGNDLIEYRKKHQLTQEQFAELMGVSKNTVYNYENGGVIPKTKIPKLKEILFGSMSLNIVTNADSEKNQKKTIKETAEEESINRNFAKLPIEEKLNLIFNLCLENKESIEKIISMLESKDKSESIQEKLDRKIKEELNSIKIDQKH